MLLPNTIFAEERIPNCHLKINVPKALARNVAGRSQSIHTKLASSGTDRRGLRALLDRYANDPWLPYYYNEQRRAEIVLDQFKRQVELKLLVLEVDEG